MAEGMRGRSAVTEKDVAQWEGLVRREAMRRTWGAVNDHWDPDLFGDLAQECRVAILRALPGEDPSRGQLGGLLVLSCRSAMSKFLERLRLKGTRHCRIKERAERASSLVVSLDAMEDVDSARFLADERPQREAEARAEIGVALARAGLSQLEKQAVYASLSRRLTRLELPRYKRARVKLERAMRGEVVIPSPERRHSQATKDRISATQLGRTIPPEVREKNSRAHIGVGLGRKCSEATKRKIGEKNRGRRHTAEAKEKIRLAGIGRVCSDETRQKMRLALVGHPVSQETRKKIGEESRLAALRRAQAKARAAEGDGP